MTSNKIPKVGLVCDEEMTSYHHLWCPNYPECPDRVRNPLDRCNHYGLVERCFNIKSRRATKDEVLAIHSKEYFELLETTSQLSDEELKEISKMFDGIYFHPKSFDAAMMAAGCTIEAVEHVLTGKVQSSFALIRPPGHHAMHDQPNGYCFLNNVSLATTHARTNHNLKKILIIDWDVHHGQGTQSLFYDDPSVLYFSCHRYEHGNFWPNLRQSDYDFVGKGEGRGFNVNVPLNQTGLKDGDYVAIFQQILLPLAFEFQPELVLISCGFDAAVGDPESLNHVTPACFAHLTHMVKEISRNICFIFEGGYCLKSLSECTALTLRTLLDEPCPQLLTLEPSLESTQTSILNCIRVLRPFWKCFQFQADEESGIPIQLDIITPKNGIKLVDICGHNDTFDLNSFEQMSVEDVETFDAEIDQLIERTALISPDNRTCIAQDDVMLQHKQISGNHPEQPERINRILKMMKDLNLLERCKVLQSRRATVEELSLVHGMEYINEVEQWSSLSTEELDKKTKSDLCSIRSIYLSKPTYDCACTSVGCALNVVDEVVTGRSRNGFAIVRPPGHHAERDQANGFCFFNTVAIAARYAQQHHQLKRVLIVDWDIHHGNGTQQAFYSDSSVLVISIHRRDGGNFYPIGDENSANRVGENEGIGFNINIPWPKRQQGDAEYLAAFQQIIMPIAYEFNPDLVLVSAGFDAALGDPLGGCNVTPEMYGHMTYMLSSLANSRLILILEGGYNLNALAVSASSCVSVLLGDPLPSIHPSVINERAAKTLREVIEIQKKFWKSLSFCAALPSRKDTLKWLDKQMTDWDSVKHDKQNKKNIVVQEAMNRITKSTSTDQSPDRAKSPIDQPRQSSPLPPLPNDHLQFSTHPSVEAAHAELPVVNHVVNDNVSAEASGVYNDHLGNVSVVDDEFLNMISDLALGEDSLQLHAVQPLTWCPHLDCLTQVFTGGIDTRSPCLDCENEVENWICLSCMEVYCSRFRQGHMITHNITTKHPLVLSFSDLSVWCYECQAYVDNQRLRSFKEAAYLDKFHCHM